MMTETFNRWIRDHGISEVECLVPDMNGVLRGKVWPAQKFVASAANGTLRMPGSVFDVTVTGDYADEGVDRAFADPDVTLHPDPASLCVAPGFKTPTAFVFADAYTKADEPYPIAPRHVLRRVLDLYADMGWSIVVAPELEFYLTAVNTDPDLPLVPPTGRSGRAETSPQPYGLEAVTEYEDIIEEIYERAEAASLHLDTMIHEAGTAQLEINFNHGEPIQLSDQVLLFKRIVRQVALQHDVYATFMAKPMENQPGSAMHLHISAHGPDGTNLFGGADGPTEAFRHFVGGLQEYLPHLTPLFAPNVNSFRRMQPDHSAPINLQWGYDNRSCGLRVPISSPKSMRVENRLPGADSNPYLAIASSLVAGYLGLVGKIAPMPMLDTNAYLHERTLPRSLDVALDRMASCGAVTEILGREFIESFLRIKVKELSAFQGVISSWERDHLLLKV